MLNIFKTRSETKDLSWIGVDIHSHLLPGLDDGATDMANSLDLIQGLAELGFQRLYTTPHIFHELYPNNPETISEVLEELRLAMAAKKMDTCIAAAAEYMVDEHFDVEARLACLPDKHVLIEMSYLAESPYIEQSIFNLKVKGYQVILAHPERYVFYHRNHTLLHRLHDMGALFQLNLLSLGGYYGKTVEQTAEQLLKDEYYHFAGTDLHHEKHLRALKKITRSGEL